VKHRHVVDPRRELHPHDVDQARDHRRRPGDEQQQPGALRVEAQHGGRQRGQPEQRDPGQADGAIQHPERADEVAEPRADQPRRPLVVRPPGPGRRRGAAVRGLPRHRAGDAGRDRRRLRHRVGTARRTARPDAGGGDRRRNPGLARRPRRHRASGRPRRLRRGARRPCDGGPTRGGGPAAPSAASTSRPGCARATSRSPTASDTSGRRTWRSPRVRVGRGSMIDVWVRDHAPHGSRRPSVDHQRSGGQTWRPPRRADDRRLSNLVQAGNTRPPTRGSHRADHVEAGVIVDAAVRVSAGHRPVLPLVTSPVSTDS
jgi:hypothetical protein